MTTTLITNGVLIVPGGELRGDLLLAGEKIAAIGIDLPTAGIDRVIDAAGCVVLPGLVDPHTHIVLDTGIYKTPDDWAVGTRTAACGGVTTVIDFATQFAGQDMHQALSARQAEVGGLAQIDYGLHMMLTALPGTDAELEAWMTDLLAAGINSIKVYTTYRPNYYQDDDALLRVFRAAAAHDVVVMIHCENDALVSAARERLVQAGKTAWPITARLGPRWRRWRRRTGRCSWRTGQGSRGAGSWGGRRCTSFTAPLPVPWSRWPWRLPRPARHRRDNGAILDSGRVSLHRRAPGNRYYATATTRSSTKKYCYGNRSLMG